MWSRSAGYLKALATLAVMGWMAVSVIACSSRPGVRVDGMVPAGTTTAHAAYSAAVHGETTLIDVREPDEILRGAPASTAARIPYRLDGSRNIQFVETVLQTVTANRSANITLICAVGTRSAAARDLLIQHGFIDVKSLEGGFQRWRASGFPSISQQYDNN